VPFDEGDLSAAKSTAVNYLLAGYAHYNCPLAWVRSGHLLFGSEFQNSSTMDAPVELRASQEWKTRTVHAFEFVAELIQATAQPTPENPFEIDRAAIEKLSHIEIVLLSGSLSAFLREVHLSSAPYSAAVEADLLHLMRLHYSRLPKVIASYPGEGTSSNGMPLIDRSTRSMSSMSDSPHSPKTPYVQPRGAFGAAHPPTAGGTLPPAVAARAYPNGR